MLFVRRHHAERREEQDQGPEPVAVGVVEQATGSQQQVAAAQHPQPAGAALVTYGEPHFRRLAERVAELAGRPLAVIDEVTPNPDFAALPGACARLAGLPAVPEALVALGGGSVIDSAKAMAASGGDFARVRRYLEEGQGGDELFSIPIIALPTTAGTGSEVTCGAALWDSGAGKKYSLSRKAASLFSVNSLNR